MRRPKIAAAITGAALLAGAAFSATGANAGAPLGASSQAPAVDPSNFVRHVTNPFYPLKPGTLLVYRGTRDGQLQTDRVYVTYRTKEILGVRTTVVRDIARHGSRVLEKTFDWFAQDKAGTVWYFGENTKSFENGKVDTEGSWKAGVDGAVPGIIMEADPHVADGYRQEFYRGHAEDQAWILRRGGTVHVPIGRLRHRLVTLEWTPLEHNVIDTKIYARGFGIVLEKSRTGPKETAALVRVHRPGG